MIFVYILCALALLAVILWFVSVYECRHFIIREYTVESEKVPSEFDGFTFTAMTDLHNNEFGKDNEKLIKAIDDIKPDGILCGGDMLVSKGTKSIDVPVKFLSELSSKYKVYFCNGNHESRLFWKSDIYGEVGKQYFEKLREAGVCILNDKKITFKGMDGGLSINGLELEKKYYNKFSEVKIEVCDIEKKIGRADKNCFNIMLAHSPVSFEKYAEWGADLVLSGHFHGGTIVLPVLGALMSPDFIFFPKYYRGRYDEYDSTMIVSGGLGTHSINIRLNNRPELIVIRLKKKV